MSTTRHASPDARTAMAPTTPSMLSHRLSGEPGTADLEQPERSRPGVCLIRPTAWQADHAYWFVPAWLARIRASGAEQVVIDLSAAHRLDFTSFGVLLEKCRDVLGAQVVITGAGAHLVQTLRGHDLLAGAFLDAESCRLLRGRHQHPNAKLQASPPPSATRDGLGAAA